MKKILIITIFIFCLTSATHAYTILESYYYGNPQHSLSARSMGMGGCGAATEESGNSLFRNPAMLSWTEDIHIGADFSFNRAQEEITRKVFDTFDNTIGDATYASNTNYYAHPSFNVIIPLERFRLTDMVNVGLAFTKAYDFSYNYEEKFYDNEYEEDYQIDYQIEGYLNDYAFGLSVDPHPMVSVGAAFHYLSGKKELTHKHIDFGSDDATTTSSEYKDMSGTQFGFGLIIKPFEFPKRLTIGLYGKTAATITGDYSDETMTEEKEVKYPAEYGLGINYLPQNEIFSQLAFDVTYMPWSNLEDKIAGETLDVELDDVVEIHLGVEHVLFPKVPVRAGFYWTPMYFNKDVSSIFFTVGAGYSIEKIMLDIGAEIGKRNYYKDDIPEAFPLPISIPEDSEFEELQMQLKASLSYTL